MKRLIKKVAKYVYHMMLPNSFNYKKSYSQSGEDMMLNTIFSDIKNGFYVDIGANNPSEQSNTNFFYQIGWRGINIDALPGSMNSFNKLRPRDINIECPISDKNEILKYYMFSSSFYNSFDEKSFELHKDLLIETKLLPTKKLSEILDQYINNQEIDFFSIDVEGMDLAVLKSNNWVRYRPKIVVIELFAYNRNAFKENEIVQYLIGQNYSVFCSSPTNVLFIENSYFDKRFGKSS